MTTVAPGTVLAGKYRVTKVLGEGGMGVVVAAVHIQLDELVALKFMLPSALGSPEAVGRFLREARAAVKLKSEHVARVSDVGTLETGAPYIVMEYLEGTDLSGLLAQRGPLPCEEAVDYLVQACDALAEAHSLGIVHRDLKPANLFLTRRRDGSALVKVLDFGISKSSTLNESAGPSLTKTGGLMGSPVYMSPEQMKSAKETDARTDVWALGIILYELVGGRPPFNADTLGGLMAQVLTEVPPPLDQMRPGLPPALYAAVAKCLQKERDNRWSSVAELAIALAPVAPQSALPLIDRIAGVLGHKGGQTFVQTGGGGQRASYASAPAVRTGTTAPGWTETAGQPAPVAAGSRGKGIAIGIGAVVALAAIGVGAMRIGTHATPPPPVAPQGLVASAGAVPAEPTHVAAAATSAPAEIPAPSGSPPAAPAPIASAAPSSLPSAVQAVAAQAAVAKPGAPGGAGHKKSSAPNPPGVAIPPATHPASAAPTHAPAPAKPAGDILDTSN